MHVLASCTALPEPILQRLLAALLPSLTQQVSESMPPAPSSFFPRKTVHLENAASFARKLQSSHCVFFSQDLEVKNSEGETPLSLAKKQGNDVVAKALKAFGTRPQPLAFAATSTAPGVAPVIAVNQAPADNADDFDENVEPARTCFPDYAFDRSAGSKDRVHVISQRLLEIARFLMKKCITGNAPLMRQSLLEWNSCFVQ
jgi:ankyrin repeat protein